MRRVHRPSPLNVSSTVTWAWVGTEVPTVAPKGGDPATGSPTATLLRLHPSRRPRRRRSPP